MRPNPHRDICLADPEHRFGIIHTKADHKCPHSGPPQVDILDAEVKRRHKKIHTE